MLFDFEEINLENCTVDVHDVKMRKQKHFKEYFYDYLTFKTQNEETQCGLDLSCICARDFASLPPCVGRFWFILDVAP